MEKRLIIKIRELERKKIIEEFEKLIIWDYVGGTGGHRGLIFRDKFDKFKETTLL